MRRRVFVGSLLVLGAPTALLDSDMEAWKRVESERIARYLADNPGPPEETLAEALARRHRHLARRLAPFRDDIPGTYYNPDWSVARSEMLTKTQQIISAEKW